MRTPRAPRPMLYILAVVLMTLALPRGARAQGTEKPVLHGKHWVAVTGKPLAATEIGRAHV